MSESNEKCSEQFTSQRTSQSAAALSHSNQSLTDQSVSCAVPDPTPATLLREWGQGPHTIEKFLNDENSRAAAVSNELKSTQSKNQLELSLSRPVKITERDKELIRFVAELRFLTFDQVARFFFNGHPGNTHRRVTQLMNDGLLKYQEGKSIQGKTRVIRVTKKGLALYKEAFQKSIPYTRQIPFSSLIHDIMVNEVRFRLSQIWKGTWIPECYLKTEEYPQVPDGVVYFPESKNAVAIEVENSLKSSERYSAIFKRWDQSGIYLVLYVATSEELYRQITERIRALCPSHIPIGVILWSELTEGTPDIWTARGFLKLLSKETL